MFYVVAAVCPRLSRGEMFIASVSLFRLAVEERNRIALLQSAALIARMSYKHLAPLEPRRPY
jgi:hypothetical protein